ncbi:MAG: UDP-N-acetylmuramoyl-L-alanyl-D-glutamate--2,6-diaminopimelate ligase [Oscillospiraceae bacterium]|nr:UDP-N-acetylmuramoyl-L-alanyl-D-glutamate--2,6-diaminopimelate ligase [Oscillospiraceae bacterium]
MQLSQLISHNLSTDCDITVVVDDSRRAVPGALFVAVKGADSDGHDYIDAAMRNGCVVVVCERPNDYPHILVEDARAALVQIAANFYGNPAKQLTMVGVTGTNGKTSVTKITADLLGKLSGMPCGRIGTSGVYIGEQYSESERTTPGTLELQEILARMVKVGCRYCVMEVSSHALDQRRVGGLQFQTAAFTNLTQDHLDYHGTMENYYQAKRKLFDICDFAIVNIDDVYGLRLFGEIGCLKQSIAVDNADADWRAQDVKLKSDCVEFGYDNSVFVWHTPGKFSVYNALTAIAICAHVGYAPSDVAAVMQVLHPTAGRMEAQPLQGAQFTCVVDFAHTPDAIANALRAARGFTRGKLIALFGCGGDRDAKKRSLMAQAACQAADYVIITSDNPRYEEPMAIIDDILTGASGEFTVECDRQTAIRRALQKARAGDVVMVLGKGDENYLDIKGVKYPYSDAEAIAAAWEALQHG